MFTSLIKRRANQTRLLLSRGVHAEINVLPWLPVTCSSPTLGSTQPARDPFLEPNDPTFCRAGAQPLPFKTDERCRLLSFVFLATNRTRFLPLWRFLFWWGGGGSTPLVLASSRRPVVHYLQPQAASASAASRCRSPPVKPLVCLFPVRSLRLQVQINYNLITVVFQKIIKYYYI